MNATVVMDFPNEALLSQLQSCIRMKRIEPELFTVVHSNRKQYFYTCMIPRQFINFNQQSFTEMTVDDIGRVNYYQTIKPFI